MTYSSAMQGPLCVPAGILFLSKDPIPAPDFCLAWRMKPLMVPPVMLTEMTEFSVLPIQYCFLHAVLCKLCARFTR